MKRTLVRIAIILLIMLNIIALPFGALADNREVILNVNGVSIAQNEARFTTVATIPIGNNSGEIGYDIDDIASFGPQDFLVRDDGSVCILDTVGEKIIILTDGAITQEIDISTVAHSIFGQLLSYYDGNFYVLDLFTDTIRIYADELGVPNISALDIVHLPTGVVAGEITELSVDSEGIKITANDYDYVKAHDGRAPFSSVDSKISVSVVPTSNRQQGRYLAISIGDRNWNIAEASSELLGILCDDKNGNIYVDVHDFVAGTPVLVSERTIRAFDKNGIVFGYARVDYHGWVTYPLKDVEITTDGNIYVMSCREDAVIVEKVTLGQWYNTQMQDLTARAAILADEYGLTSDILWQGDGNTRNVTSLTRGEVIGLAHTYRYHSWQSTAANRTKPSGYSQYVTIPTYVANSGNNDVLTGVPYCWGGFDSISQFDTKRGNGNTTGNTSSSYGSIVPGTTGVDCSGFLSRIYGLTTKKNSLGFVTWGYPVSSITNMKQSDFFAKDGHVILFNSLVSNQTSVNIFEATTGTFGRVINRQLPITDFSAYVTRSPWN